MPISCWLTGAEACDSEGNPTTQDLVGCSSRAAHLSTYGSQAPQHTSGRWSNWETFLCSAFSITCGVNSDVSKVCIEGGDKNV